VSAEASPASNDPSELLQTNRFDRWSSPQSRPLRPATRTIRSTSAVTSPCIAGSRAEHACRPCPTPARISLRQDELDNRIRGRNHLTAASTQAWPRAANAAATLDAQNFRRSWHTGRQMIFLQSSGRIGRLLDMRESSALRGPKADHERSFTAIGAAGDARLGSTSLPLGGVCACASISFADCSSLAQWRSALWRMPRGAFALAGHSMGGGSRSVLATGA